MHKKPFFTEKFENTNGIEIKNIIDENSYFSMESAINTETVKNILSEVDLFNLNFNSNDITPVHTDTGYFASSGMARSETLYNLLTSNKIFDICREYLGKEFRLKCHRVYSTDPFTRGTWHTDNKDHGKVNTSVKGIVFLIYLNDIIDGEFQAIKKSHKKSHAYNFSNFDEDFIKNFNKDDVTSFKYPAGSIIIFDSRTIHRAKPYFKFLWKRKSLFFQIDNDIDDGEKIIVNTSFIKKFDKEIGNFLGIGKKNTMPHEPYNNKIKNLGLINIFKLQIKLFHATIFRTITLGKFIFTGDMKRKIKSVLKIKRGNYNTKFKK